MRTTGMVISYKKFRNEDTDQILTSSDSGPDDVASDQASALQSPAPAREAPSTTQSTIRRRTRRSVRRPARRIAGPTAKMAPPTEPKPTAGRDDSDTSPSAAQAGSIEQSNDRAVKAEEEDKRKLASQPKPEGTTKNLTPEEQMSNWCHFMVSLDQAYVLGENLKFFAEILYGDIGRAQEYASYFIHVGVPSDAEEMPFGEDEVMDNMNAMEITCKELEQHILRMKVRLHLLRKSMPTLPQKGGYEE